MLHVDVIKTVQVERRSLKTFVRYIEAVRTQTGLHSRAEWMKRHYTFGIPPPPFTWTVTCVNCFCLQHKQIEMCQKASVGAGHVYDNKKMTQFNGTVFKLGSTELQV